MKKTLLTLGIIINAYFIQAQLVTTFFSETTMKIDDAMVLDSAGNLYGSHFMGSNIYKVTPTGEGSIFASGFNTSNGLAFDSHHNLFVCDLYANRIYKLSIDGTFIDTFNISSPSGIIKSIGSDTMIFTQYTANTLSSLAPDGTITTLASGSPMVGCVGLAYDNTGLLYVANFTNREIYSFSDSVFSYVATVPGPPGGALGFITFAQGSIWATSYNDHKIYRVYQEFVDSVSLYAGSIIGNTDGALDSATFNLPNGIISSVTGDSLYVSDYGTGHVRIITLVEPVSINTYTSDDNKVFVYPNPVNAMIHVKSQKPIDHTEIINNIGDIVIKTNDDQIYVGNLPPGMYIARIFYNNTISSARFIIQ